MMKYIALVACVLCAVQSQRPPYAGTSNRYPVVLPQFVEEEVATRPSATLANRIDPLESGTGGNNGNTGGVLPDEPCLGAKATTTFTPTTDLPIDARGDIDLINRIKTWPKEKQPFWFLNWQQIQEHRGDPNNGAQAAAAQTNTRGSFAG